MSVYHLNRAIHTVYIERANTVAFRDGNFAVLDGFDLTAEERTALESRDFVKLWSLHVHPVILFHLSAVLNPREWYMQNVVPKIAGVPNQFYDFYNPPAAAQAEKVLSDAVKTGAATTYRRPRIGPRVSHVNINVWHAVVFAFFILLWAGLTAWVGSAFLPSPQMVVAAAINMAGDGTLHAAILQSIFALLCGYALSVVIAIPAGLLMGGIHILGKLLEPYVDALSSMPRVAFLPLIVVFLGLGYEAKIFMIFLGAVMPILLNTYAGVLHSDGELIEMARSAGASGVVIFRKIVLPGALPHILTGLRVGASLALINTVVAELYTAVSGLGGLLSIYGNSFRMAPYFVVVGILAVIGVVLMHFLRLVERRLMRWRVSAS